MAISSKRDHTFFFLSRWLSLGAHTHISFRWMTLWFFATQYEHHLGRKTVRFPWPIHTLSTPCFRFWTKINLPLFFWSLINCHLLWLTFCRPHIPLHHYSQITACKGLRNLQPSHFGWFSNFLDLWSPNSIGNDGVISPQLSLMWNVVGPSFLRFSDSWIFFNLKKPRMHGHYGSVNMRRFRLTLIRHSLNCNLPSLPVLKKTF